MLFNERASCTDHPCAQFASAGWQPTGSPQNRQHLGCIPTLFAVIRRSFSQKDKESRHHIGCDGASYKCTQWHFLIRISKNKCSSSNSAKKGDPESNPLYHLHGKCSIQKQPSLLSSLYWYLLTMYPMPWREMPAHWKGCGCPVVEDSRRW